MSAIFVQPNDPLKIIQEKTIGLPFVGFTYAARMVVDKAKENKATLLYTVPFSAVVNIATATLGVLIGVVKLVAAPLFLAMALVRCANKEKARYWLEISVIDIVSAGFGIASPLVAIVNTIAPHKLLEWVQNNQPQ